MVIILIGYDTDEHCCVPVLRFGPLCSPGWWGRTPGYGLIKIFQQKLCKSKSVPAGIYLLRSKKNVFFLKKSSFRQYHTFTKETSTIEYRKNKTNYFSR